MQYIHKEELVSDRLYAFISVTIHWNLRKCGVGGLYQTLSRKLTSTLDEVLGLFYSEEMNEEKTFYCTRNRYKRETVRKKKPAVQENVPNIKSQRSINY
jgi:hypothetical protein